MVWHYFLLTCILEFAMPCYLADGPILPYLQLPYLNQTDCRTFKRWQQKVVPNHQCHPVAFNNDTVTIQGLDRCRPGQIGAANEEVPCGDARTVGKDCRNHGETPVGNYQDGEAGQGRRIPGDSFVHRISNQS